MREMICKNSLIHIFNGSMRGFMQIARQIISMRRIMLVAYQIFTTFHGFDAEWLF